MRVESQRFQGRITLVFSQEDGGEADFFSDSLIIDGEADFFSDSLIIDSKRQGHLNNFAGNLLFPLL